MITMTTYSIYEYMKVRFPHLGIYLKNGNVDKRSPKSIGVFLGSDTRSSGNLALGGIDCTTVRMLPINILIRWTDNQWECDELATAIYNTLLLEGSNFTIGDAKFALVQLLDGSPKPLGRDERNVCEVTIRANFYYYV